MRHEKQNIRKSPFPKVRIGLFGAVLFLSPVSFSQKSHACCSCIFTSHIDTQDHISEEFDQHQTWMIEEFVIPAMQDMTNQLTAVALLQVEIIGAFLDAKHQLETQRLFQEKMADAHKDYHPSTGLCTMGTGARALAASDRIAQFNQIALTENAISRQLHSGTGRSSAISRGADISDRVTNFAGTYCHPADNNNGLGSMCSGAGTPRLRNLDIDYTRLVDAPLTIAMNLRTGGATGDDNDQQAVISLQNYLFAHRLTETLPASYLRPELPRNREVYLDLRSLVAKRSVAVNSFNAIVGMKAQGSGGNNEFLAAVLRELDIPQNEVIPILGNDASYYAQMEILSKKIYQSPHFYTNLYDKPVNVARKGVAMQAIQLMQDRDLYRSQLRMESMLAVLLETELIKIQKDLEGELAEILGHR